MRHNKFYNFSKKSICIFAIFLTTFLWINILEVREEYYKKNNLKSTNYLHLISTQSKIYIKNIKHKIPSFRRK